MSAGALSVPQLLTAREVAGILRVSLAQVHVLKDRIGYVVVGSRSVRFEPEAVFAYVQAQRRCHEPAPVSSSASAVRSGRPLGPTTRAAPTNSPRVAAITEQLRRGSRRVN